MNLTSVGPRLQRASLFREHFEPVAAAVPLRVDSDVVEQRGPLGIVDEQSESMAHAAASLSDAPPLRMSARDLAN
jgi:hypothetical protein